MPRWTNSIRPIYWFRNSKDYTNSWSLENESSTPNLETGEHCPDFDKRRKEGGCGKLCPSELDIEAGHSSRTFPVRVWEHLGAVSGSTDSWIASHMGLDLSHQPLEKWGDLEKGQVPGSQRGEPPPQKVERKGASERQEGGGVSENTGGGASWVKGPGSERQRGAASGRWAAGRAEGKEPQWLGPASCPEKLPYSLKRPFLSLSFFPNKQCL